MLTIMVFVLVWALLIYTFLDCVRTPRERIRLLPKIAWLLVIVFVGTVLGPLLWLVFGKRRGPAAEDDEEDEEDDGNHTGGWIPPDDNPEFLKSLNRDDS